MSNAGSQLISELGRRGQLGAYFDYAAYRQLRRVESLPALSQFLVEQGISCPGSPPDVGTVADALQHQAADRAKRDPMTWLLLDPRGCLPLLFFPFWLLFRLIRAR